MLNVELNMLEVSDKGNRTKCIYIAPVFLLLNFNAFQYNIQHVMLISLPYLFKLIYSFYK